MRILESLLHFFTPRHTNNHKARALHFSSLSTYIAVLLVTQIIISAVARFDSRVLGYASNINVGDLLRYTNQQRAAAGLQPVVLNDQLTTAANDKARDMFTYNYWAHNSPQGRDPWSFIVATGYHYIFAGENLARDFGDSKGVVDAWMNSPSHRENLLNEHYRDIGFAVVNGTLAGNQTTLVVQMFGSRAANAPTVAAPVQPKPNIVLASESAKPATPPGQILNVENNPPAGGPKFDILGVTRNLSFGLVVALMGILVVDSVLVNRRRIVRVSGHNLAHLMVLIAVLVLLNVLTRGIIL